MLNVLQETVHEAIKLAESRLDQTLRQLEDLRIAIPDFQNASVIDRSNLSVAEDEFDRASLEVAMLRSQIDNYGAAIPTASGVPPSTQPSGSQRRSTSVNPASQVCGRGRTSKTPTQRPRVSSTRSRASPNLVRTTTQIATPALPPATPTPPAVQTSGPSDAPSGTSKNTFIVVTIGRRIGVFNTWCGCLSISASFYQDHLTVNTDYRLEAAPSVKGLPEAIYQGFNTYEAALDNYLRLKAKGPAFARVVRSYGDTDDVWGTVEEATQ